MKKETKQKIILLILLLLLFFSNRILLCNQAAESGEFLFRGNLAKDLLDGLKTELNDYRITEHDNSMFLIGVLTAPFFLLFGDSFLSLYGAVLFLQLLMLLVLQ